MNRPDIAVFVLASNALLMLLAVIAVKRIARWNPTADNRRLVAGLLSIFALFAAGAIIVKVAL